MASGQYPSSSASRPRYQANYALLIGSLIVIAIVGGGGYLWHRYALGQVARGFLDAGRTSLAEAEELERTSSELADQGQLSEAATQLRTATDRRQQATQQLWQYLQFRPEDDAVWTELAWAYGQLPTGVLNPRRALTLFRGAISRTDAESAWSMRAQLAELLNEAGEYAEAAVEGRAVVLAAREQAVPPELVSRAWIALAISYSQLIARDGLEPHRAALREWGEEPGALFELTLREHATDWRLAIQLASLYRSAVGDELLTATQREQLAEQGISLPTFADQLVTAAMADQASNWLARLNAYFYRAQFELPEAGDDIQAAAQLNPEHDNTQMWLGLWLFQQFSQGANSSTQSLMDESSWSDAQRQYLTGAVEHLQRAVDLGAQASEAFAALGECYQLLKQPERAIAVWTQGIATLKAPDLTLYRQLIGRLVEAERFAEAEAQLAAWRRQSTELARSESVDVRTLNEAIRMQDYVQGLLELQQDRLDAAVAIFDKVIAADGRRGTRVLEIYRLLGDVWVRHGATAQAAHYFEMAARLAPDDVDVARRAGSLRAAMGQLELARTHWERVVNLQPTADHLLQFAQLLFQIQLQRSPAERQWLIVDNALRRAEQAEGAEAPELVSHRKWLIAAVDRERAPGQWVPPEELAGDEPLALVAAMIEWHQNAGDPERAAAIAEAYVAARPAGPEQLLARVQLLVSQNELDQAEELLAQADLTNLEDELDQAIQLVWSELELIQGHLDASWQRMDQLALRYRDNRRLLAILANAAIELGQVSPEPAWWEPRLVEVEGRQGPIFRYLAAERQLRRAASTENPREARTLLNSAETLARELVVAQSNWPRAMTLLGRIYDQQVQLAVALNDAVAISQYLQQARRIYQQAFDLGDRTAATLLRLSELVDSPEEAARLLGYLDPGLIVNYDPLASRMVGLKIETNQLESAEAIAVAATRARANDSGAWLSLARVMIRQNRLEEAEATALKARQLAESSPTPRESMLGVFQYYVTSSLLMGDAARRQAQVQKARELIEPLVGLEPAPRREFFKAVLLDAIGDDEAAVWFLRSEQSDPNNVVQLQATLNYFLRHNVPGIDSTETGIRLAQKLAELQPDSAEAKTQWASLLMERGRPEDWEQASQMLAATQQFSAETMAGRRAQALLLWERNQVPTATRAANLATAAELLQLVVASPESTADDHLLLASIYREWSEIAPADGAPSQRDELLQRAVQMLDRASQSSQLSTNQLLLLTLGWIDLESWDLAERSIQRLEDRLSTERIPNPAALALRVSVWKGRGESDIADRTRAALLQMIARVDQVAHVMNDLQKARLYVQIAAVWESIEARREALEWNQKAVALGPEMLAPLIQALVRDGQKQTALEFCQQAFQTRPTIELVHLLAFVLTTGRTTPEEFAAAEPLLAQAQERFSTDVTVLGSLANIRSCQPGQTQAAIQLYQAGLAIEPRQFALLNNLATLYGEIPERREEALQLIQQAIDLRGNLPALLNTKARILMNLGRLEESRQLLLSIVRRQSDPRYWWQLSEVEWAMFEQTGLDVHRRASQTSWQEAVQLGIESSILTPDEYQRLEHLTALLQGQQID